jgi:hypothetical protein
VSIEHAHTPLSHALLTIILEPFRITHESAHPVGKNRSTQLGDRGIEFIREPIHELSVLFSQLRISNDKLRPDMLRNDARTMGDVSEDRNSGRWVDDNRWCLRPHRVIST